MPAERGVNGDGSHYWLLCVWGGGGGVGAITVTNFSSIVHPSGTLFSVYVFVKKPRFPSLPTLGLH